MINDVFKPKNKEEVIESIRNANLPAYRLSSFFDLIDNHSAAKYRKWCLTVFHTDPKDMEVRYIREGSPWYRTMRRAIGQPNGGGDMFASNATLRIMRIRRIYYAFPKGELTNILTKFYDYERIYP